MKKYFAIIILICLIICVMTGCSSNSSSNKPGDQPQNQEAEIDIKNDIKFVKKIFECKEIETLAMYYPDDITSYDDLTIDGNFANVSGIYEVKLLDNGDIFRVIFRWDSTRVNINAKQIADLAEESLANDTVLEMAYYADEEIWFDLRKSTQKDSSIETTSNFEQKETSLATNEKEEQGNESVPQANSKPVDGIVHEDDNFLYVLYDNGTIEITGYNGNDSSITIPSTLDGYSVSRIGESAFENCTSLVELDVWNGAIGKAAFKGCSNLTELYISSDVPSIEESAFENCSSLVEVDVWKGTIGKAAFKGCSSLTELYISSDVTSIGEEAFENCSSLVEVDVWKGTIGKAAFKGCSSLTELYISSDVTSIGEEAFMGCSSLDDVSVWNDNISIGINAFANCPKLKDLPKGATNTSTSPATQTISPNTTSSDISQEEKDVPNSVETIAGNCFSFSAHSFMKRFDDADKNINGCNYGYMRSSSETLYYELIDISSFDYDDVAPVGMATFANTSGDSLSIDDSSTENIIHSITVLVENVEDVPNILVGCVCAADFSLDYTTAYNMGHSIIDCAGTTEGYTYNGINYVIVTDNEYYYIIITVVGN